MMSKQFRYYVSCLAFGLITLSSCQADRSNSLLDNSDELVTAQENLVNGDGVVDESEAIAIAQSFVDNMNQGDSQLRVAESGATIDLVYREQENVLRSDKSKINGYYVYNVGDHGYVIVSGSETTMPIVGFSNESSFNRDDIPVNMAQILKQYADEANYAYANIQYDSKIASLRSNSLRASATVVVAPLLGNIKWNQAPYYNAYCPAGCPVGCVATATCQIMRYWGHPDRGTGSHRSTSDGRWADHSKVINWSNIPRKTLTTWNNDVAQLCYNVAVGLDMQFSTSGSGAWQQSVPKMLKDHYYYASTTSNRERSSYSYDAWVRILRKELDARRPIQYAGSGSGGGHSFVCDGYATNDLFHFNWGWGGSSDGYFRVNALNPGSLGIGGGTGGFNSWQTIVVGIKPNDGGNPDPGPSPIDEYPASKGQYARSTYIARVQIANIDNSTYANTGYNYFSNKTVNLSKGKTYRLSVVPGFKYDSYPEYWRAWIDYNGNKHFDYDEQILQVYTPKGENAYVDFTVPESAGKSGRLRISMKWGSYASSNETFQHGEVEDYPVEFTDSGAPSPGPVDPPTPDPTPDPSIDTEGYPLSYAKNSTDSYIRYAQIGNYYVESTGSPNGYSLNEKYEFPLEAGRWFKVYLRTGYRGYARYFYWRAWIDVNRNGQFEDNEMIIQKYGSTSVYGSASLPSGLSGKYRLRISMSEGGYVGPNAIFENGEVEDYRVVVK